MATYVPNASDTTQPTGDKKVSSAAPEFRTAKSKLNQTLRVPEAGAFPALPALADRAMKFLWVDAAGNVGVSAGTGGGDASLRTDLANYGGSLLVGFRATGLGAIISTIFSKLGDVVTPMDFGAIADGLTHPVSEWVDSGRFANLAAIQVQYPHVTALTDEIDWAALQAAIVEVESRMVINTSTSPADGTQVLTVPDGYYRLNKRLNITKAISIVGHKSAEFSTGARIFQTTDNDTFRFTAAGGGVSFSLERLTLISTVTGNGHHVNVVAGSPGYNSWRVSNCCFSNPQQMSIRATGNDIKILDNTFDVSGWNGECIQLGSNVAGDIASDVHITGNDFFNIPVRCVLIYNAQGVEITGNTVSQPDASAKTGAFIDGIDSMPVLCKGVMADGNVLYGVSRLFGIRDAVSCSFSDNVGYGCGQGGSETFNATELAGTCDHVSIQDNTIEGAYGTHSFFKNNGTLTNIHVSNNNVKGSSTGVALVCGAMTGKAVNNHIVGWASLITASDYYALGFVNPGSQSPTYGATINIDCTLGEYVIVLATNGTAFTIALPTKPSNGQLITIQIHNGSGGALGVITWNAIFKMTAFTNPADGFSRLITFRYSSGLVKWTEVSRSAADIPN